MAGMSTVLLVARAVSGTALLATAAVTGSAATLAAGLQALVAAGRSGLLRFGDWRSNRPADPQHPYGYGREVYFWAGVVTVLAMGVGAGIAFGEGVHTMLDPNPVARPDLAYTVLGLALLVEAVLWWTAAATPVDAGRDASAFEEAPTARTAWLDHGAAVLGLVVALAGVVASDRLGVLRADGAASLVIGVMIAAQAVRLAIRTRSPLIGAAGDPDLIRDILGRTGRASFVNGVNEVRTMQFGPFDVLVNVSVDAHDALSAGDVESGIAALQAEIRAHHPSVSRIFVEI